VVVARQVHAARVVAVDDAQGRATADGLVCRDGSSALAVLGADCPGLVVTTGTAIATAHCGWRGCAAGIVGALVAALDALDQAPRAAWRAFIGPGIAGAAYEVDAPVLAAGNWPSQALRHHRDGHALLDLRSALAADLRSAGIHRLRIAPQCTAADPRLRSFRHDGPGCTQALLAWREPEA